jgi:hypothetical protein
MTIKTLTVTPSPIVNCRPGTPVTYTISWAFTASARRMILRDDAPFTQGSHTLDLNIEGGGTGSVEHTVLCPEGSIGSYPVYLTITDQDPDGPGHTPTDAELSSGDQASAQTQVLFSPSAPPTGQ